MLNLADQRFYLAFQVREGDPWIFERAPKYDRRNKLSSVIRAVKKYWNTRIFIDLYEAGLTSDYEDDDGFSGVSIERFQTRSFRHQLHDLYAAEIEYILLAISKNMTSTRHKTITVKARGRGGKEVKHYRTLYNHIFPSVMARIEMGGYQFDSYDVEPNAKDPRTKLPLWPSYSRPVDYWVQQLEFSMMLLNVQIQTQFTSGEVIGYSQLGIGIDIVAGIK
jgi:hypothetical protein